MNAENQRLKDPLWKKWGPYLSERQWGTVREDYSADGQPWQFTTHDMARSKAWRWGEEGLAGFSDDHLHLCFSVGFWNTKDPILKERLFGLAGNEGNHGEDVKELYYYLDATPTHSYMKMLYKYPQQEFPYRQLVDENRKRTRMDPEFELLDTGVFDEKKYFDIFIEYAKAGTDDILIRITAHNRFTEPAPLHILPTIWFRNNWAWGYSKDLPQLSSSEDCSIRISNSALGNYALYSENAEELLFCNNETNTERLYQVPGNRHFYKDGINDHLIHQATTVNPSLIGTKAAVNYKRVISPETPLVIRLRLSNKDLAEPFADYEAVFNERIREAGEYYDNLQKFITRPDLKMIQRQAFAGLLWNKQYYYYNVQKWLNGDPEGPPPPSQRLEGRNHDWKHLNNSDIISMPDKWEYPWFASWDLAFHCICLALIDPEFAKNQLKLLTHEWYMHPNGQLPAYEWSFSDVNPPVHAWATWRVYETDKKQNEGRGDTAFLETVFHRLIMNFTWWVNRKDDEGNNIFEGGFLGMDNIGLFDRNIRLPDGTHLEQSDGTSWMAMYSLNMMRMALELAKTNPVYQDMATKFFEHFLYIASALSNMGENNSGLWDEEDQFFYDALKSGDGSSMKLKIRSMVGLVPLFAVEILDDELLNSQQEFRERLDWFLNNRPEMANLVSRWGEKGKDEKHLLSLLRGHRMKKILYRMLDENEFLSDFGIRSLSRIYEKNPYEKEINGTVLSVRYSPGESDIAIFGGNSNWRGPVWMPANFLIIESLLHFHDYYGDDFRIEYPTHSGNQISLKDVAHALSERLIRLFTSGESGARPVFGDNRILQDDPAFRDYLFFNEYFHAETGAGLGASHQTGWTALVVKLIQAL
jgi:Glycosyl hydrolase family 63 C-terminal domain